MAQNPSKGRFPDEMALTYILVVADLASSVSWYRDVLEARFHSASGGTSAVFEFNGSWILLVTGGGPTADKSGFTFAAPVAHRTPPYKWEYEKRCFFGNPDGHLFEVSQV